MSLSSNDKTRLLDQIQRLLGTLSTGTSAPSESDQDEQGDIFVEFGGDTPRAIYVYDETDGWQVAGGLGTSSNPITTTSYYDNVDLGGGSVDGNDIVGLGGSTTITPGFASWTDVSVDRPGSIVIEASAQTDGTSEGSVVVDVDEDGGTSADYTLQVARADPGTGAGVTDTDSTRVVIPAGAQYQIRNVSDPNTANSINVVRQFIQ